MYLLSHLSLYGIVGFSLYLSDSPFSVGVPYFCIIVLLCKISFSRAAMCTVVWFLVSWVAGMQVSLLVCDAFASRLVRGVFNRSVIFCVWAVSALLHLSHVSFCKLVGGVLFGYSPPTRVSISD